MIPMLYMHERARSIQPPIHHPTSFSRHDDGDDDSDDDDSDDDSDETS
jgi:hypothetical protein